MINGKNLSKLPNKDNICMMSKLTANALPLEAGWENNPNIYMLNPNADWTTNFNNVENFRETRHILNNNNNSNK